MKRHPQDLIRLVCDKYGVVRLDRSGNAPGRGAYICFDASCLRKALTLSRLTSAFRCPVVVPEFDTFCQALSMWLYERLKSYFQLAQKAGILISGSTSLRGALAHTNVACVVLAKDIAISRAEEYRAWCRRHKIPCITLFSKEELGQLIGKSQRSAVGFTESHFYRQISTAVRSLEKLGSSKGLPETNSRFCQPSS
jgi:ribosomal protein L7Ae-like RNA K-turn-binding protein